MIIIIGAIIKDVLDELLINLKIKPYQIYVDKIINLNIYLIIIYKYILESINRLIFMII